MQRIIFTILGLTICGISLYAQEPDSAFASVRYSFTHVMDTAQRDNPLKENMILYLGRNMSNYTSYDRIERAAKTKAGGAQTGNGPTTAIMNGKTVDMKTIDMSTIVSMNVNNGVVTINANPQMALNNSYFKDQSASKISYIISSYGKIFSVEEKIPVINWTVVQETKEIMGLQCQKAVGDFKGRSYEAWFCSQLPYNNGPWKLGGLPGLILEAYDTKKEVVFSFTSFENASGEPVSIALPSDLIKTTPKEFRQYQQAIEKDRQAMVGSNGGAAGGRIQVSGLRVTAVTHDMNGNEVKKPRKMNNPIELTDK